MITFPGTKLATWRRPTAGAKLTVDTYLKQRPGSLLLYVYLFLVCFFFFNIYLFIFGCAGSYLQHTEFLVVVCGIYFPDQESKLAPLHSEHRVLAAGPPGKPPPSCFRGNILQTCQWLVRNMSFLPTWPLLGSCVGCHCGITDQPRALMGFILESSLA